MCELTELQKIVSSIPVLIGYAEDIEDGLRGADDKMAIEIRQAATRIQTAVNSIKDIQDKFYLNGDLEKRIFDFVGPPKT